MYWSALNKSHLTRKSLLGGVLAVSAAGLFAAGGPVWSQTTDSATFDVTATAVTTCTISATNQDFGNYTGNELTIDGTGNGVVIADMSCSVGFVDAVFCLDEGTHWSGTHRNMRNQANLLDASEDNNIAYEIYLANTSFSTLIGETPDAGDTTGLACNGGATVHPGNELFNDAGAGSLAEWKVGASLKTHGGGTIPGSYSDTLTATFVFQ